MTAPEYKLAIACLGMNQRQAADWLGISHRSSQNYAGGQQPIPKAIAMLLRATMIHRLNPHEIAAT